MQQLPNNDLYKFPSERKKGLIGTVVIHAIAFVLLYIFGFTAPAVEPEEGILVNFGFEESGFGMTEPSVASASPTDYTPTASTDALPETVEEEPILTQDFEEAPVVQQVDPEAEIRRQQEIEAERIRQEELEAERIRTEREQAEQQRLLEEQMRQQEIIDRTRNAFADTENEGTESDSEGILEDIGNQGAPNGSAESPIRGIGSGLGNSGISYDLEGRGVMSLPLPQYDYQEEGKVVVEVRVDRNGKVIQATPGKQGTTTYVEYLHNAAKEAALKTVFDAKPNAANIQIGTITYNFKLN